MPPDCLKVSTYGPVSRSLGSAVVPLDVEPPLAVGAGVVEVDGPSGAVVAPEGSVVAPDDGEVPGDVPLEAQAARETATTSPNAIRSAFMRGLYPRSADPP